MPAKKREVLDTGSDKRYVRRDDKGQLTKGQVDVGKASAADQRQHSTKTAKSGQGDKGDRPKK